MIPRDGVRRDHLITIFAPKGHKGLTLSLENSTLDEVFDFMHDNYKTPNVELYYEVKLRVIDPV
jgi:hypothetical protein